MNPDDQYEEEIKFPVEIEQYERKIYDLKQLIEISKGLNSTLDYNILIDSILLTCMGQMQLFKAGIFLRKEIDEDIYVLHRNYKGFELDHSMEYEISGESNLIKFLDDNFKCYTLEEMTEILGDDHSLDTMRIIKPCLLVPLKGKGKINGIIILGERINKFDFSETEKEYLLNIASLAGIAIQNAYLYEMATTDMMTKLKIHHFFQAALMEERDRSVRHKTPLSLIMIDIDHFKNFNDTYGHTCGDLVLKNVARLIQENVRQIDIAARYGGEEFAVILPNTDMEKALMVAERVRSGVEAEKLACDGRSLGVTVSLGVAQMDPRKDRDNNSLITRADKALYMSKQNGRNRVSILKL